ncbi:MAG: lysyl-tRNA synthetase, class II [Parcubacteria group bacterium Athens0714_24]|nr:MAG: lysyl-tRNA synthetase, class II [Parcubacteria group bacterium Athens0714_24]
MSSIDDIRAERVRKLEEIKKAGIEPFPVSPEKSFLISDILANFNKIKKPIFICGRIMAIRSHGGSVFFDVNDGSGILQAYLKKDDVSKEQFFLFEKADIGDFVELKGKLFKTKKKEKTLKIGKWRFLAKSLLPLPEKWHGLQDIEERFRKRYLDLLMNQEVKERFLMRSRIISELRDILIKNGFIEVETPILQPLAGGALAEPFTTHHNSLDIDLNLRIAPELYLKKLLIGGFNKVFEIGRNFRNEGIDVTHNPEFTMLELYEAYQDAKGLRQQTEKFLKELIKKIFKKPEIVFEENKINFNKKFSEISYYEVLKRYALIIDAGKEDRNGISLKAKQFGIKVEDFETKEKIMDNIYKKMCRPKIIQPTFIIDYPVGTSPLAKRMENNKEMIDRFQLVIAGMEIINGFSELNDPVDQKERFAVQDKAKEAGDKEVSPSDKDYLEAMEYGMPPAAGLGIGIDRLVMLLTNTKNIREVILFPTLRPKK